ncbi:MAG: CRISPR system precrRNA processing endoribonuclease RAMP protein Cas6 [Selenomonas bovis]|nr:CRISPR system precrRNA processing endoribonuclease RAMP protein Cas6 [Selenomonas bovis]
MIGAITWELETLEGARLEGFAGRLLHAAFFRLLASISPALSKTVHDEMTAKPFSLSPLLDPARERACICRKEPFFVQRGTRFLWRASLLHPALLQALLQVPVGTPLHVGHVPMRIAALHADGTLESGVLEPEELIATAIAQEEAREITLRFDSPVCFRRGSYDYPLPEPVLIFSSLADKWQQAAMPLELNREMVKELATHIYPTDWSGRTQRIYFRRGSGLSGFTGFYTFTLKELEPSMRSLALLLTQFAVFSGTGRMTAQGFGKTQCRWR